MTKSSSGLRQPGFVNGNLGTRGRTASQNSIMSVNEEDFQVSVIPADTAATGARTRADSLSSQAGLRSSHRALNSTYVRD